MSSVGPSEAPVRWRFKISSCQRSRVSPRERILCDLTALAADDGLAEEDLDLALSAFVALTLRDMDRADTLATINASGTVR